MKRWIFLAGLLIWAAGAVVVCELRKVDVPLSPAALLYLVADTEQELTRMPVSFTRMSDEEEIRIGNELARVYGRNQERGDTPEIGIIERHLTRIGEPVAVNAHRRLPYKFHYIPDSYFVNAFALPGGHVFVGGGLLALMDSEDELAAVLGHEIEHIDHYDCSERVQREQALRKIPLGGLFEIPIEVFEAGYSKDQELQADRDGTKLAVKAGYSANGAMRMFETLARLFRESQSRAKTPQQELSRVAEQTLEGYFRSHPLPSERIAQVQKLIADEGWAARPERDLAIAYIFWTDKAQNALTANKYAEAEQSAAQSLKLRPDQPKALLTLAQARFAQANFNGEADAFRKILEIDKTSHPEIITAYAHALAAADQRSAPAQFQDWVRTVDGDKPREIAVAEAGLALINGATDAPRRLESELSASSNASAPLQLGDLAWWEYLAGNYSVAAEWFRSAQQLRPTEGKLVIGLSWSLIEMRRYADALGVLAASGYEPRNYPEMEMATAVARWQAQEKEQAMVNFNTAVAGQPEWDNANWVRALYSPLVARTIQEMQAERERRKKEKSHST